MHHVRTRRLTAGAVVMALLGGLFVLAAVQPAQAVSSASALEITPELATVNTGSPVTVTAKLVNPTTGAAEATVTPVTIDFKYEVGTIGVPISEYASPDNSCIVLTTTSSCTIVVTRTDSVAIFIRGWVHETSFTNVDIAEGRLSSVLKDCTTETSPTFGSCVQGTETPGGSERDQTDVVKITWTTGVSRLDCEPETRGVDAGVDTTVTCTVRDAASNPLPNQRIDGENLNSANDPDSSESAGNADYDDVDCDPNTTGAQIVTNEAGACTFTIQAAPGGSRNNQSGIAQLCFWADTDDDSTQPANDTFEPAGSAADGGGCGEATDAAENADTTDRVTVTWGSVATLLDVTPESQSGAVGSTYRYTALVTDGFGGEATGATTVTFKFIGSSVHSTAVTCTTPGGGPAHPGQCSVDLSSAVSGIDTICASFGTAPNATCNGETQSGGTDTARIDVVNAIWTAAATTTTTTAPTTTTTTTPPAEDVAKTQGYTLVGADGGIYNFGTSQFHGSTGNLKLNQPVIGISNKKGGTGYWLVAKDGGIFTFGDAEFFGSTGDKKLNAPVLGMESTPSGKGYWLFAADGGIFTFGDAQFFGSTGDTKLNAPAVGLAVNEKGDGYWLVAQDGGIFSFGNVPFHGSTGSMKLNQPVFDMTPTAGDKGYWLVAKDGGIFSFGDAENKFYGSAVGATAATVIGIGATPTFNGYWIADSAGGVFPFGDARALGDRRGQTNNAAIVGFATVPKK